MIEILKEEAMALSLKSTSDGIDHCINMAKRYLSYMSKQDNLPEEIKKFLEVYNKGLIDSFYLLKESLTKKTKE